jgi:flagellar P-ring protein precursor FlgI
VALPARPSARPPDGRLVADPRRARRAGARARRRRRPLARRGAPTPGRAVERAPDGARELADDASCLDEAAPSLLVRGRADRDRLTPPIGSEVVRQATEHLRRLGLALALVVGAGAAGLPATLAAQDVKIRDLTTAEGAAPIRVVGYGIAVGLDGTGDRSGGGTRGGGMTVQSVVNLLRNFDVEIPSDLVRTRNAAVVLVTAEVSPYLRAGGRFEVQVASLGDARSLRGGVLYMTPLVAEAGGRPVAVAQGPLMLSDGLAVRDRFGPPTSRPPAASRAVGSSRPTCRARRSPAARGSCSRSPTSPPPRASPRPSTPPSAPAPRRSRIRARSPSRSPTPATARRR